LIRIFICFATCLLLCLCLASWARIGNQYNINIYNGLPSNNVYNLVKDHNGYLWIATDNGILKYNGYTFRLFNLQDGLSNADIWFPFEDKGGRMWLGSIADEIGYIYKDKYTKAVFPNFHHVLYPIDICYYNDAIIFSTPYVANTYRSPCIVVHDTVFPFYNVFPPEGLLFIVDGNPMLILGKEIYRGFFEHRKIVYRKISDIKDSSFFEGHNSRSFCANYDSYVSYEKRHSNIRLLNFYTGNTTYIDLCTFIADTGPINLMYIRADSPYQPYIYPITDRYIYKIRLGSTVRLQKMFRIDSLVPVPGNDISGFYEDAVWNCVMTKSKGLYINYNSENYFIKKENYPIEDCRYVGSSLDGASYWWSATTHDLVRVKEDQVNKIHLAAVDQVNELVPINKDTCLILENKSGDFSNYWLIGGRHIVPAYIYKKYYEVSKAIPHSPNDIYTISKWGFNELKYNGRDVKEHVWDIDRYKNMAYDTLRQAIWAYTYSKVYIHNIYGKDTIITQNGFRNWGIKRLEKVIIDGYGNIFLKDYDKLVLYDPATGTHTELLQNYNLCDAGLYLYNNIIVVAGRFGVLFYKVTGFHKLSKPYLYQNIKNAYYNYVKGVSLSKDGVLINTENGIYQTPFPSDSEMATGNDSIKLHEYKFLMRYNNELYPVADGDTLRISPANRSVQFDVINPLGNGTLKFMYQWAANTSWFPLNANEINVDQLAAGKYVPLFLVAYDNVWRSDKIKINLYLVPYWWQTEWGTRIVYSAIFIVAILLVTSAVLITRKIIIAHNDKRNKRLELELKSIYAQINPHFIFNILGSALLLIKQMRMEEAYAHVSKFSQLLRAYMRSSRNKYIILRDEIENLRDYIELQQSRFKNKFDYQIVAGENIDTSALRIPSLLLQPIVENAINHGLFHKHGKGHLDITFQLVNDVLTCTIEDDGIGRDGSKAMYEKSHVKKESYGNKMIEDLVTIFNKYEGSSIEVTYTDRSMPAGTIVEIKIKNMRHEQH